jgi:hypothetical protein
MCIECPFDLESTGQKSAAVLWQSTDYYQTYSRNQIANDNWMTTQLFFDVHPTYNNAPLPPLDLWQESMGRGLIL